LNQFETPRETRWKREEREEKARRRRENRSKTNRRGKRAIQFGDGEKEVNTLPLS